MIVGTGDIASILNDRLNAIFFASGVSNSQCTDPAEFEREKNKLNSYLLVNLACNRSVFYFGTISATIVNTPYTKHKKEMEELVRNGSVNYNIIRLGNINWGTNPNTFINYLKAHPEAKIRDEWKYMVSKEQLLLLTDNLPLVGRNEISIFGEMKKVKDCL